MSGITSKWEHTKETSTRNCETKSKEKNSSKYNNEGKKKDSITSDKEDEESVNVLNGILNIYECGKKSPNQRTYKRA